MPFEKLKRSKIDSLNLALLTFFTLLSLALAIFIPFFGAAGMILLPVPATILINGGRIRDGIICAAVACIFLIFMDFILMPVVAILIVIISFIYKNSICRNKSKFFIISSIFFTFCGAAVLYLLINSAVYRTNYAVEIIKNYNSYIDRVFGEEFISEYSKLFFLDSVQFKRILEQTRSVFEFIPYIIPGLLIFLFSFTGLINYIITSRVLRRFDIDIKPFTLFKNWDIPWYYCWGVILSLVLILIPYGGQNISKILDIAGFNLLAVFGPLYFILGISVVWGLMEKFKVPPLWKIIIFIIMGLFSGFTVLIIPFIGLIDVWVNFRRLKREKLV
jgi:uncharacterized protein YybS (DUF2232 family)